MKRYNVIIKGAGFAGIITGINAKKAYPYKSILMFKEKDKGFVTFGIPNIFHELGGVEKNMMGTKLLANLGCEVQTV